ncbi:hypothetical protein QQZ08_008198 [Neonectria magnoliae]|uniref:Uncharacterized protein n=1 Tax=Neonectria magnoliae TaxID=2732573 RepID=A0ABR1HW85_9HYPO
MRTYETRRDDLVPSPLPCSPRGLDEAYKPIRRLDNTALAFYTVRMAAIVGSRAGTVVFERGGLKVYAAPWQYAFCRKLNRLCDTDPRPYDLTDAVVYLHECFREGVRETVGIRRVRQWCQHFNKIMTDEVLRRVDEAYEAYGRRAIDWHT